MPTYGPDSSGDRQLGILWGGAAALCVLLSPLAPFLAAGLFACPFKQAIGIPCPGCGTTRAALALARFDLLHALTHYPLQSLGWVLFIGGGLTAAAWTLSGRPLPSVPRRLPRWAVALVSTVIAANWAFCIATGV